MTGNPPTTASPAALFLRRVALTLLAFLLVLYLADLSWFQLRAHVSTFGAPTASIHRIRLLAIPGKANKVEYQIDALQPEEDIPCARSLLPHARLRPCWYVARHANDPIPM